MAVYAGFGLLSDAWRVFEPSPIDCFSNMLLWNSILRANVTNGYCETSGGGFAAGAVALIPNWCSSATKNKRKRIKETERNSEYFNINQVY